MCENAFLLNKIVSALQPYFPRTQKLWFLLSVACTQCLSHWITDNYVELPVSFCHCDAFHNACRKLLTLTWSERFQDQQARSLQIKAEKVICFTVFNVLWAEKLLYRVLGWCWALPLFSHSLWASNVLQAHVAIWMLCALNSCSSASITSVYAWVQRPLKEERSWQEEMKLKNSCRSTSAKGSKL